MKKFLLGACLFLSVSLALAQIPKKTWQEVELAVIQGNEARTIELLQPWAERGDARAQSLLGVVYYDDEGTVRDYAKAREWLEKAAAQGDADAEFNLGVMYDEGDGVAQDYAKAREWWKKSAAQGNAAAQYSLGWIYYEGHGVAQDYARAREWWEKAAAQTENPKNIEVVRKARQALEQIRRER